MQTLGLNVKISDCIEQNENEGMAYPKSQLENSPMTSMRTPTTINITKKAT